MASELARLWSLDPSVTFLNHGSFGATPRVVQAAQSAFRERIEAEPVRFFVEDLRPLLDATRARLGAFVNAPPESLALVTNATQGVATVLANLAEPEYRAMAGITIGPGDDLLYSSHEYPACINQLRQLARRTGATTRMARMPFPIVSADEAAAAVLNEVTSRTKLVLISHVTSPTALVLPIGRVVNELEARGVACLVDGAHAPAFIDMRGGGLDVSGLNASYYTANCHKWICSPKGSAFLQVRQDRRAGFRPLALSNDAERPLPGREQFLTEFDFVGTSDPTSVLSIPAAIAFMESIVPGGIAEMIRRNHALALEGRDILCRRLGLTPPAPDAMLGNMATLKLPATSAETAKKLAARPTRYADALQDALIERHRIQIPVWSIPAERELGTPRRLIRLSAQLYNTREQYETLAAALVEELAREAAL